MVHGEEEQDKFWANRDAPGNPRSCRHFGRTENGFRFPPHVGFRPGSRVLSSGHWGTESG